MMVYKINNYFNLNKTSKFYKLIFILEIVKGYKIE